MSGDVPASWRECEQYARLIDGLLANDMPWIIRRTEDMYVADPAGVRRKVRLDIDMPKLRDIAREAHWQADMIPIPLGWMEKSLTLDFTVHANGSGVPIWDRNEDSKIGQAALLACLADKSTWRLDAKPDFVTSLYRICHAMPQLRDVHAVASHTPCSPALWQSHVWPTAKPQFARYLRNKEFHDRLMLLTVNYMPMIELPSRLDETMGHQPIVDFDIVTASEPFRYVHGFWPRGDLMFPLTVRMSSAMEARREHLRLHLPDDVEFSSPPILAFDAETQDTETAQIARDTQIGVSQQSAVIYRTSANKSRSRDYLVILDLWPRLDDLTVKAIFGLGVSLLMLVALIVGWLIRRDEFLVDSAAGINSFSFSVLQLIPTAAAGYVIASNARTLQQLMLVHLRRVTTAAVVAGIVASVVTSVGLGLVNQWLPWVWLAAASVECFAVLYLALWLDSTTLRRHELAHVMGHTMHPRCVTLPP